MRRSTPAGTSTLPRKIALFGAFGVGNLGNECTLQALLHNIRIHVPHAEISCICPGPEQTRSAYKIASSLIKEMPLSPVNNPTLRFLRRIVAGVPMELLRWIKAIIALWNVDMLVMTGTGMLGDFGITPLGLHYEILKWTIAAKLCGCKVIFLCVGAGPLCQSLSRHFVKAALSFADYRSYRDHFSKDYLKSIGFASECDYVYPDLAFSFPRAMISPEDRHRRGGGTVVGVGVMTYLNRRSLIQEDEAVYRDYIAKVGNFVSWLLEKKYIVRLLIGDVSYDQRARKDLRMILEGRGFSCRNGSIIDDPASSVEELLLQLAATDFVVASRFHNILLALMLSKPVLAISYHEKVDALMADAGLAEFCQDIERIDLEKMIEQFDVLQKQAPSTKIQLDRNAKARRAELADQYSHIFSNHLA